MVRAVMTRETGRWAAARCSASADDTMPVTFSVSAAVPAPQQ